MNRKKILLEVLVLLVAMIVSGCAVLEEKTQPTDHSFLSASDPFMHD